MIIVGVSHGSSMTILHNSERFSDVASFADNLSGADIVRFESKEEALRNPRIQRLASDHYGLYYFKYVGELK